MDFKDGRLNMLRMVLLPLSWIYRLAVRVHNPGIAKKAGALPIVSVGNLEVGGTGKSPITQAICNSLSAVGCEPAILSRGYGGKLKQNTRVDQTRHTAHDCGDEPLMHVLAGYHVFVGGDR